MEYWEEFQKFEFSNETLMVLGGLLLVFALFQILKSSMKLVFWVLLGSCGAISALYGYDRSSVRLPAHLADEVRNIAGYRGLTDGMMQALCLRVMSGESASLETDVYGLQTLQSPATLQDVVQLPIIR